MLILYCWYSSDRVIEHVKIQGVRKVLLLDAASMLIESSTAIAACVPGIDPFLDLVRPSGDHAVAVPAASYLPVV